MIRFYIWRPPYNHFMNQFYSILNDFNGASKFWKFNENEERTDQRQGCKSVMSKIKTKEKPRKINVFRGFLRGADRIWTGGYWCCRPLPYHLATAPHIYYNKSINYSQPLPNCNLSFFNDSDGNRTRVTAVKGRCLNRLTTEPHHYWLIKISHLHVI